jgi:hypothetical protein
MSAVSAVLFARDHAKVAVFYDPEGNVFALTG